jgi:hypothetical protein
MSYFAGLAPFGRSIVVEKLTAREEAVLEALREVSSSLEPKIARLIARAFKGGSEDAGFAALKAAIASADVETATSLLLAEARLQDTIEALHAAFARGAKEAQGLAMATSRTPYRYDPVAPSAVNAMRSIQADLVQGTTVEQREAIRAIMLSGHQAGLGAAAMAREVRDAVGLNRTQAAALMNFKRALEKGDVKGALARKLGPKLAARTRKAIAEGKGAKAISALVGAYRDKLLAYRSATIARTESIRALNAGQWEAMKQAAASGAMNANTVRRFWIVAKDERTCEVCVNIASANTKGVGLNQPFSYGGEAYDHPPAHPNCRCAVSYRSGSKAESLLGL